jgi:hypothetical protein
MSDKTLKRLVLGQMGLLAVLAAVLVWVIFPDGASFAWRGFYQPQNPATLEGGIQLPIAIRIEESRPAPLEPKLRVEESLPVPREPWYSRSDPYEEQRMQQELDRRIDCLERREAARGDRLGETLFLGC